MAHLGRLTKENKIGGSCGFSRLMVFHHSFNYGIIASYLIRDSGGFMRNSSRLLILVVIAVVLALFSSCNIVKSKKDASKSGLDERVEQLKVMIEKGDTAAARKLFISLETKLKKGVGVFKVWYYFALYAQEESVRAEYGKKFLAETTMPPTLSKQKVDIYRVMGEDASHRGDLEQAREFFKTAIVEAGEEKLKVLLQAKLAQLEILGKPALAIGADTWINTSSLGLALENLKGQAVVLVFRAPWCEGSRSLTPLLNKLYNEHKAKGLMIIDCVKLYGFFQEDNQIKEALTAAEEIALLRKYITRNKISFPTALANEGTHFETYKVSAIPALFFIDKTGAVADIQIGSGNNAQIESKIKKILEVKSDGKS
jgi:thiol-disulfide isomerase/thioredoxin